MDYKNCIKCRLLSEPPKFNVKLPPLVPEDYMNLLKATDYNLSLKLEKINYLINKKMSTLAHNRLIKQQHHQQHAIISSTSTPKQQILFENLTIANLLIFSLCAILFIFLFLLAILFIVAYFR